MKNFQVQITTQVYVGPGEVQKVKEVAATLGKKAMLIAVKDHMRNLGFLQKIEELLKQGGVEVVVNDEADPNPRASYIDKAAEIAKTEGCDFFVGLGGGSAMDSAKAIAFMAANGGSIMDFLPPDGARMSMEGVKDALPILAITTTAGTGSEVTMFTVITKEAQHEKPGIGHPSMYPTVSIVDPELMLTVPKKVTASTGMDVLFHAMEAYLSTVATPFTDLVAEQALKLVMEYMDRVYERGEDLEARAQMAWANTLAGFAIVQASTVAIHGMGHPVGGYTDAPHGMTMCALGPAYLRYTWDADPQKYARIAEIFGVDPTLSTEEKAKQSGDALANVLKKYETNVSLTDLGVKEEMIEQLATDAFATMGGCMGVSLKELTHDDAVNIYKMAL